MGITHGETPVPHRHIYILSLALSFDRNHKTNVAIIYSQGICYHFTPSPRQKSEENMFCSLFLTQQLALYLNTFFSERYKQQIFKVPQNWVLRTSCWDLIYKTSENDIYATFWDCVHGCMYVCKCVNIRKGGEKERVRERQNASFTNILRCIYHLSGTMLGSKDIK